MILINSFYAHFAIIFSFSGFRFYNLWQDHGGYFIAALFLGLTPTIFVLHGINKFVMDPINKNFIGEGTGNFVLCAWQLASSKMKKMLTLLLNVFCMAVIQTYPGKGVIKLLIHLKKRLMVLMIETMELPLMDSWPLESTDNSHLLIFYSYPLSHLSKLAEALWYLWATVGVDDRCGMGNLSVFLPLLVTLSSDMGRAWPLSHCFNKSRKNISLRWREQWEPGGAPNKIQDFVHCPTCIVGRGIVFQLYGQVILMAFSSGWIGADGSHNLQTPWANGGGCSSLPWKKKGF